MFAIGDTTQKVMNGNVFMPVKYRLKNKVIYAKWADENALYLSDSKEALDFIAGRKNDTFHVRVDKESRLMVGSKFNNRDVKISGCITSIELAFQSI